MVKQLLQEPWDAVRGAPLYKDGGATKMHDTKCTLNGTPRSCIGKIGYWLTSADHAVDHALPTGDLTSCFFYDLLQYTSNTINLVAFFSQLSFSFGWDLLNKYKIELNLGLREREREERDSLKLP